MSQSLQFWEMASGSSEVKRQLLQLRLRRLTEIPPSPLLHRLHMLVISCLTCAEIRRRLKRKECGKMCVRVRERERVWVRKRYREENTGSTVEI